VSASTVALLTAAMLALQCIALTGFCPGPIRTQLATRSRAAATMQFDEETGRSREPPPLNGAGQVERPVADGANEERGVRALGFIVGGFTGNLVVSLADGLSASSAPRQTPQMVDDSGLYRMVLPLFESGTIPSLSIPGWLGGDAVRRINQQANEKYQFFAPPKPAPLMPLPAPEPSELTEVVPGAELSGTLSSLQDAGSAALGQLSAALSPLPQPAFAAEGSLLTGSALDGATTYTLAGGGVGAGLLAHVFVPLLFGLLGALLFDLLSKQDGPAAAMLLKGGRTADIAGQRLWALSQQGASKAADAAALKNAGPEKRRMPWEED